MVQPERGAAEGTLRRLAARWSKKYLKPASLAHLQQRLRQADYHILHFIGHGGFNQREQDGFLMFVDNEASGRGQPVSASRLGRPLYDENTLRLGVLNTCEGARTSPTPYFAGAV